MLELSVMWFFLHRKLKNFLIEEIWIRAGSLVRGGRDDQPMFKPFKKGEGGYGYIYDRKRGSGMVKVKKCPAVTKVMYL